MQQKFIFCLLGLMLTAFLPAQSLTYSVDYSITGMNPEQSALREAYRIPWTQRTSNLPQPVIQNTLFALDVQTGSLELYLYKTSIAEPSLLGEAYDRAIGTHKYWYHYGACDNQPEYQVICYERLGEYYLTVTQCGNTILSMGNPYLKIAFEPWNNNLTPSLSVF